MTFSIRFTAGLRSDKSQTSRNGVFIINDTEGDISGVRSYVTPPVSPPVTYMRITAGLRINKIANIRNRVFGVTLKSIIPDSK